MNNNHLFPAMVMGIGPFAQNIIAQTAQIYLASDPNRRRVTQLMALGEIENKTLDLVPMMDQRNGLCNVTFPQAQSSGQRQAFIERLVKSADQIRTTMQAGFHDLRRHADLMEIGLDKHMEKPVNLFVLADLTNPTAAAALLPLAFLLQDISLTNPNTHSHLLLNTAIFPEKDRSHDAQKAALFTSLQSLDQALTSVENEKLQNLLSAMDIRHKTILQTPVTLFDFRKPNFNDAADMAELETIFANGLVGMMSGNLADHVSRNRPEGYIQKTGAYYQSLGAANLIYDPASLIAACAKIFARKILAEGILGDRSSAPTNGPLHEQALHRLGTLTAWFQDAISGAGRRIRHAPLHQGPSIAPEANILHLAPVDFEQIRCTPWVNKIETANERFSKEALPQHQKAIAAQEKAWKEKQLPALIKFIKQQVENPALYPDGHGAILDLISALEAELRQRKAYLEKREREIAQALTAPVLKKTLKSIQSILDQAHPLPHWGQKLPTFCRKPLGVLINLRWILRHYRHLEALKDAAQKSIATYQAVEVERIVLHALTQRIETIMEDITLVSKSLKSCRAVLSEAQSVFPVGWHEVDFPLGTDKYHWLPPFRCPAVDREFAHWAFTAHQPNLTATTAGLIEKSGLLANWEALDAETVQSRLMAACCQIYAPLEKLSAQDVLQKRLSLMREAASSPQQVQFEPVSTLLPAALPLMRPNFDALGGSGYSSRRSYLQVMDPKGEFIEPIQKSSREWTILPSGDPNVITAVTLRDLMPLSAFTPLTTPLQESLARMAKPQRKRLENIFVPMPKLAGEDLVEKRFEWTFQEESFCIELPISQTRFRDAQRAPRLPQEQWTDCVVGECPELNYLSACFLNIFLQHPGWHSYDQTSLILAFVQENISYAFDKDTTPKEEWPRHPLETLQEEIGDCEDVAILTAAVMSRLGFQTALLLLPGHCALGIAGVTGLQGAFVTDSTSKRRYYYAEATGSGWQIGVIPENHQKDAVKIHPVERLIAR
jgi:hypothetical protein